MQVLLASTLLLVVAALVVALDASIATRMASLAVDTRVVEALADTLLAEEVLVATVMDSGKMASTSPDHQMHVSSVSSSVSPTTPASSKPASTSRSTTTFQSRLPAKAFPSP